MKRKAFRSKNIYTALSETLVDGYIILEGNTILFIGNENKGKEYINHQTEVFDMSDHFIMPGFHDFHVHMVASGILEKDGILRDAKSTEEAAKYLYNIHKNGFDRKWIMGGGWDPLLWSEHDKPVKGILDRYFPETPVFLLNKECHGAWVNSAALKFFDVTKNTPDPAHGFYERYADGELTGYLHEAAAMMMQERIFATTSDEVFAEYTKNFIRIANQYGITSLGDVAGGAPMRESAYKILEDKNELTARINFYSPIEYGIEKNMEMKKLYNSSKLKCRGVKAFIDGTPQGYSGYMLDDYSDRPGDRSHPLTEPEKFIRDICAFDKAGIQIRIHACGDAGVKLCLDAIETAQEENGQNDLRHCIEHLEVMDPTDIPRFGKLGVIASVQPEHMPKYDFQQHPFHKILGEERIKYAWPFGSIKKTNGILAFGTDSPVVNISPFRGIFRAVTRLTNDLEPEGGWNPGERVSIHEALKAYTWGGAYGAGQDKELGTLEAGKLADIVVIENNLFDCADDKQAMFDMKVVMTIMNGEIVYQK